MIWKIDRVIVGLGIKEDQEKLANLLADGWEPFAVTGEGVNFACMYHFRKREWTED